MSIDLELASWQWIYVVQPKLTGGAASTSRPREVTYRFPIDY